MSLQLREVSFSKYIQTTHMYLFDEHTRLLNHVKLTEFQLFYTDYVKPFFL